jgi:hypothetical protein
MTPSATRPDRIIGIDLGADALRSTPRVLPDAVVA